MIFKCLLLICFFSALFVAADNIRYRNGYLRFPFLFSLLYAGWFLVKVPGYSGGSTADMSSLNLLLLLSVMGLWSLVAGWNVGRRKRSLAASRLPIDQTTLWGAGVVITAIALGATLFIDAQPQEALARQQWSGSLTILAFISSLSVVSLIISLMIYFGNPNTSSFALLAVNICLYLPKIFIFFRRADIFEFILAVLLCAYFVKGRIVARKYLVLGVLGGLLLVNGVGQLRSLSDRSAGRIGLDFSAIPSLSEVAEIDWMRDIFVSAERGPSEINNAVRAVSAVTELNSFSFGGELWNRMVVSYVPGQIVGPERKVALLTDEDLDAVVWKHSRFERIPGQTYTGFVEAYRDFWFLGALVWWLTGYTMGRLFAAASAGSMRALLLYASLISNGVHTVSHSSYYLLTNSVLILLACYVIFLLADGFGGRRRKYRQI